LFNGYGAWQDRSSVTFTSALCPAEFLELLFAYIRSGKEGACLYACGIFNCFAAGCAAACSFFLSTGNLCAFITAVLAVIHAGNFSWWCVVLFDNFNARLRLNNRNRDVLRQLCLRGYSLLNRCGCRDRVCADW